MAYSQPGSETDALITPQRSDRKRSNRDRNSLQNTVNNKYLMQIEKITSSINILNDGVDKHHSNMNRATRWWYRKERHAISRQLEVVHLALKDANMSPETSLASIRIALTGLAGIMESYFNNGVYPYKEKHKPALPTAQELREAAKKLKSSVIELARQASDQQACCVISY